MVIVVLSDDLKPIIWFLMENTFWSQLDMR